LIDRAISFGGTFGAFRGLPGPGDGQSFRWSGEIYLPAAGQYTFYIDSNGPQRLTLAGSVLIDDFASASNTSNMRPTQRRQPVG